MGIFHGRLKRAGSLQLSINAIVILILAITMLGLGLGFVRKAFTSAEEQLGSVSKEIEQQMVEKLELSGKPLAISHQTLRIPLNTQDKVFVGIKNLNPTGSLTPTISFKTSGKIGVTQAVYSGCPSAGTLSTLPALAAGETYTFPIFFDAKTTTGSPAAAPATQGTVTDGISCAYTVDVAQGTDVRSVTVVVTVGE